MPGTHSLLSPSGASRWLKCTRSARLEAKVVDRSSDAADEGTLAHDLGEQILKFRLKRITESVYLKKFYAIQEHRLFSPEMVPYMEDYADYVLAQYARAKKATKDAQIMLERKVDISKFVPECKGTVDVQIWSEPMLEITDLKYGKGVPVTAVENKQMRLYALGALEEAKKMFKIEFVKMTIYQPRLDSITEDVISVDDLYLWADTEVYDRAQLAWKGEGEFSPGENCQFCKVKSTCRALADFNLEIAVHDFAKPELIDNAEISDILDRADLFINWIGSVKDYALKQALAGANFPGYKLVRGRANRKIVDEAKTVEAFMDMGFLPTDIMNTKMKGIGDLEKLIGVKTFDMYIGHFVEKPPGSPTLVTAADGRPELNTALEDFEDFIEVE